MAGRNSLYTPELQKKAEEYLDNYKELGDLIPMVEGLALHIKVGRSTIYDWAKEEDKPLFSDTLEAIKEKQKKELINNGLANLYNAQITKLMLGTHGLSEKTETDITSKGKALSTFTFVPVGKDD